MKPAYANRHCGSFGRACELIRNAEKSTQPNQLPQRKFNALTGEFIERE